MPIKKENKNYSQRFWHYLSCRVRSPFLFHVLLEMIYSARVVCVHVGASIEPWWCNKVTTTSEFNSISNKMANDERAGLTVELLCQWLCVCKYYDVFLLFASLWDSISSSTGACLRTSWSRVFMYEREGGKQKLSRPTLYSPRHSFLLGLDLWSFSFHIPSREILDARLSLYTSAMCNSVGVGWKKLDRCWFLISFLDETVYLLVGTLLLRCHCAAKLRSKRTPRLVFLFFIGYIVGSGVKDSICIPSSFCSISE